MYLMSWLLLAAALKKWTLVFASCLWLGDANQQPRPRWLFASHRAARRCSRPCAWGEGPNQRPAPKSVEPCQILARSQKMGSLFEGGPEFHRSELFELIYRWRQSQKQAAVKGVSSLCSLLCHRRAHPSFRTASVLSTRLRDCQACGRIGREAHGKYM